MTTAVVFAADRKFRDPLAVTLFSMLAAGEQRAPICVLTPDLERSDLPNRLFQMGDIELIRIDADDLPGRVVAPTLGRATYIRLLAPALLGHRFRTLLYLDCDILVRSPPYVLLEDATRLLHNRPLAVVQDRGTPFMSFPRGVERWAEFGMQASDRFFNAGVLLLDVDRWTADEITEKSYDYLADPRNPCLTHDQEALNAAVGGNCEWLGATWNFQVPGGQPWEQMLSEHPLWAQAGSEPAIVHFAGTVKPWSPRASGPYVEGWRGAATELIGGRNWDRRTASQWRHEVNRRLFRAARAMVGR